MSVAARLRARLLPLLRPQAPTAWPPSPLVAYDSLVRSGALVGGDLAQERAVLALTRLHDALLATSSLRRWNPPSQPLLGVYLHGPPGRGKTLLARLLVAPGVVHLPYAALMLDVHARLHALGRRRSDPLDAVAEQLASPGRGGGGALRVLSVDELDVTDVADACVTARLRDRLAARGVALVATSNRAPERLYEGGLNRALFEPFVAAVRAGCDVVSLSGDDEGGGGVDHRTRAGAPSPRLLHHTPPGPAGAAGRAALERAWAALLRAPPAARGPPPAPAAVAVPGAGRCVAVPLSAGRACRFAFGQLCGAPLAAADYAALCDAFDAFCVTDIPASMLPQPQQQQLAGAPPPLPCATPDELTRFVTLLDALYDRRKLLLLGTAAASVGQLFAHQQSTTTQPQQPATPRGRLAVAGHGGASGRSTTVLLPADGGGGGGGEGGVVEWSATGISGAALAGLQAGGGGGFAAAAAPRAASRCAEMVTERWAGEWAARLDGRGLV